jgi:hypothetical protein
MVGLTAFFSSLFQKIGNRFNEQTIEEELWL